MVFTLADTFRVCFGSKGLGRAVMPRHSQVCFFKLLALHMGYRIANWPVLLNSHPLCMTCERIEATAEVAVAGAGVYPSSAQKHSSTPHTQ